MRLLFQLRERLFDEGCDLVILACNTASAAALRRMQDGWIPEGKRVSSGVIGFVFAEGRLEQ